MSNYILDENDNPKVEKDIIKWAQWFEANREKRILRQDKLGNIMVSTVFLGIDHNFFETGRPVLWETMIFGGKDEMYQERYSSRDEALKGHEKALEMIQI